MNLHVDFNLIKELTDEKVSQQQGWSTLFSKEQGRRIQLPQEQNSKEQGMKPVPFAHEQDRSDNHDWLDAMKGEFRNVVLFESTTSCRF